MEYASIIEEYKLPANSIPISLDAPNVLTFDEYKVKLNQGEDVTALIPVVDNPIWILDCHAMGILSANAEGRIARFPVTRNKILDLEKGNHGLCPTNVEQIVLDKIQAEKKFKTIKSQKEDNKMADFKDLNLDDLNNAGDFQSEIADVLNDVQDMDVLGGEKTTGMNEDTPLDDPDDYIKVLGDFNREYGALHVIITNADHRTAFTTAKASKKSASNAGNGNDPGALAGNNGKGTGGNSELKRIVAKDGKPGPIKGAIISIPKGGVFKASEIKSGQMLDSNGNDVPLAPRENDTDLEYSLVDKDQLIDQIAYSFDALINQDPDVYKATAGQVEIEKKIKDGVDTYRLVSGRKSPIIKDGAYFPLKMFKYLPAKAATQQELDELNFSAFYQLFKESKTTNTSLYNNLESSSMDLVKQDVNDKMVIDGVSIGRITSSIYTMNKYNKAGIVCTVWGTKNEYPEIRVPRKQAKLNKDGVVTSRIVTVDCLKCLDDELLNSSLKAEEFKPLVEQFGSILNREKLSAKFGAKARVSTKVQQRRSEARNSLRTSLKNRSMDAKFDEIVKKVRRSR